MTPFLRSPLACLRAACIVAFAAVAVAAEKSPEGPAGQLVPVEKVEVIASPAGPVVVLRIRTRSIPVFVDTPIAISILEALGGQAPARPLSHDLMRTILDSLDAKVTRAVITLKDGTYRGALTIDVGGTPKVFDARSSDAIALALRFKAPILLDPALVESAGVEQSEPRANPI